MNGYPKILIVGHNFNNTHGGGITLNNLFKGWDKNSIAAISSLIIRDGNNICEKFYQVGNLENKRPFPFNFIRIKVKSGEVILKKEIQKTGNTKENQASFIKRFYLILNKAINFFFISIGISNLIQKWTVSDKILEWIKAYDPDILYTQLSTLSSIRFVQYIHDKLNIPVAIHIMDDWPSTINKYGLFSSYWRNIIDKEFRYLINEAKILLCISEAMSEEYKKRYGKNFIPFHNPIETDKWLRYVKKDWKFTGSFKILYAGRIGTANSKSIFDIAHAIENLNLKGLLINLEIFSPDYNKKIAINIGKFKGIKVLAPVPHSKMPELLSGFDLLMLPLDFSKLGLQFSKYSMPTKTSEYMISGTPIIVYAPAETALAKYAKSYKWAKVVTEKNLSILCDAIEELYNDGNLRASLGSTAVKIALDKHDAGKVREEFREVFCLY